MTENEQQAQAQTKEIPPIKNYPLYFWRVIRKLFVVAVFGIGSLLIFLLAFPVIRIFTRDNQKFRKTGHHLISCALEFYINLMSLMWVTKFKISKEELQTLRNLKGAVIVANHPSLLDVVFMFAFVRDADCIVKSSLKKTVVGGIVNNLYISNNVDFSVMQADCVEALKSGSNLIIFPEGTRTPREGSNPYKKGAARIAIAAGAPVQPIHIGGNDKYGLGKGEKMWCANHEEHYKYEFKVLPQIDTAKYAALSESIAAKHLTEDMRTAIDAVN